MSFYIRGTIPDIITERYTNGDVDIDYSYSCSLGKYLTNEVRDEKRIKFFSDNNIDISDFKMVSITLPPRLYDELGMEAC